MPISSITYPGRYSYAYGNIVYQVTSTAMSQYKFRFVFDVYMNSERIARLKVTPQNEDWGRDRYSESNSIIYGFRPS